MLTNKLILQMDQEVISISSNEDASSAYPPGPASEATKGDSRRNRPAISGMVLLMAVEVTTMFVKAPFSRNSPPYAEEPLSPLLASFSTMSPERTVLTETDEVDAQADEEDLLPPDPDESPDRWSRHDREFHRWSQKSSRCHLG